MRSKSAEEIELMRRVGKLTSKTLTMIRDVVEPGMSTEDIDDICHKYITQELGASPSCLGYKGYKKSICTSVNNVICHGVPNSYILKDGDIVNVDITVNKFGFHGDSSIMIAVGEISDEARRLIDTTQQALYTGIRTVKPGALLADVGSAIENYIKPYGYSIVEEFTGHGIGKYMHEPPYVFHFHRPHSHELVLEPGMTFTIEPMINIGKKEWVMDKDDGWTVYTEDGSLSAQWEHTVLVTEHGVEILTKREDDTY
jgi:methionyl aminopeptidase